MCIIWFDRKTGKCVELRDEKGEMIWEEVPEDSPEYHPPISPMQEETK
jgi:hypothetical protein